jgi:glutamate-1-semialdehyde aminotransferase
VGIHFRDGGLRHARDTLIGIAESGRAQRLLHLGLLRRGIFAAPRGMFSTSTPMTTTDIDQAAAAFAAALTELRGALEDESPALLAG